MLVFKKMIGSGIRGRFVGKFLHFNIQLLGEDKLWRANRGIFLCGCDDLQLENWNTENYLVFLKTNKHPPPPQKKPPPKPPNKQKNPTPKIQTKPTPNNQPDNG